MHFRWVGLILMSTLWLKPVGGAEPLATRPATEIPELLKLQQQFAQQLGRQAAEREDRLTALGRQYDQVLGEIEKAQQSRGDLEGVLAVRAERERVAKGEPTTPTQLKSLPAAARQKRAFYDQHHARIIREQETRSDQAARSFAKDLEGLQSRLTQQGDIASALTVRQAREAALAGVSNQPSLIENLAPSRAAATEWEILPFPQNSDWPGPKGRRAVVNDGEVTLMGQPVRTKSVYHLPVTVECELLLTELAGHGGCVWIAFVPADSDGDLDPPRNAPTAVLGYQRPDGGGGHVTIEPQNIRLSRQPFQVEAQKVYRMQIQCTRQEMRVSVDDERFPSQDIAIPYDTFRIRVMGWQPANTWKLRHFTVR
jgi:hypothetical protein